MKVLLPLLHVAHEGDVAGGVLTVIGLVLSVAGLWLAVSALSPGRQSHPETAHRASLLALRRARRARRALLGEKGD
jgi:hypothetical protein